MLIVFLVSSASRPALLHYAPDYTWHFVGYFVMGLLAIRAFARGLAQPTGGKAALFGALLALVYAFSDEWHQSFVRGRVASLQDIAVDALGIVSGLAVLYIYWWRLGGPRRGSLQPSRRRARI